MRLLLTLLAGCLTGFAFAQTPRQSLRIQISYERAGQYLEQAVETIEATNTVGAATKVEYRAGRSVTMLPGFEARSGSTFTAAIRPVASQSDSPLQLTAYPNPFEQSTVIEYNLPTDGKVNLWITDAQGKVIGQLVQAEHQSAGKHRIEWTPQALTNGVYLPVVEINQQRAAGRLIKK